MTELIVFDIRDNLLTNIEDLIETIKNLKFLGF